MFHVSLQDLATESPIRKRSPLTPSNPNACPRFSGFMTVKEALSITAVKRPRHSQTHTAHLRPEQLRDQRRRAFLKKVRQAGDDKRWETRSDQILRRDFLMQHKQWELEQATSAPPDPPSPEEDPDDPSKHQSPEEHDMVDQILSQEDEECQALACLLHEAEKAADKIELEDQAESMSEFGSEAEDYDSLFMDVACQQKQEGHASTSQYRNYSTLGGQEMDMSLD